MLRFIDLGKQIGPSGPSDPEDDWPRQFAFYTTITDRFISLDGEQVFESWKEFEAYWNAELLQEGQVAWDLNRFKNLCPAWVFDPVGKPAICPLCGLAEIQVDFGPSGRRVVRAIKGIGDQP